MKLKHILIALLIIACTSAVNAQNSSATFEPSSVELEFFKEKKSESVLNIKGTLYKVINTKKERGLAIKINGKWVKHGAYYTLFDNGKTQYKRTYSQGKKHGESIQYFPSGNLYGTVNYENGLKNGQKYRYKDKKEKTLYLEETYKNGSKEGVWVTYYADGKTKKTQTNYKDNKKNGSSCSFELNGNKRNCKNFKDNKEIK